MKLEWTKEFREFVASLHAEGVKYVLVGGYAVAWHGYPRFTKDMDFFVERSPSNAERILKAMDRFGIGNLGLQAEDLLEENTGIFFGLPPFRIDVINFADGVVFTEVWESREEGEIEGQPFHVINRDQLIRNKRASGRTQDLADVEKLEKRG